jgi:type I restriction enzyme, S subunit
LGKTAVYSSNKPLLHGMNLILLRTRKKTLEPYFLHYLLNYYRRTGKFIEIAQHAVNQSSLNQRKIMSLLIPTPPINTQKTIVAEIEKQFSRLDEAVANLKRVKANLKRYKAAVLKAAVEGKLTEEWRKAHPDVEPASKLLGCILSERRAKGMGRGKYTEPIAPDISKLPELPEGWVWASIDQAMEDSLIGLDRGRAQQTDSPKGGVPYIKMNNVTMDGRVVFSDLAFVPASKDEGARFALRDGDLLFNTRNSKELVGKIGIVHNPPRGSIYNNNLMRMRVRKKILPAFVCAQMCSVGFRGRMELVKKATTNVAAMYAKDLFPLAIALPPTVEQEQIVEEVESRMSMIDELQSTVEANFTRADRLRQSILQHAFAGQLVCAHGSVTSVSPISKIE